MPLSLSKERSTSGAAASVLSQVVKVDSNSPLSFHRARSRSKKRRLKPRKTRRRKVERIPLQVLRNRPLSVKKVPRHRENVNLLNRRKPWRRSFKVCLGVKRRP